ncbi:MAG: phosphatase PAP2 family protein [Prevotellaceae bacterium]|jgi:undecaprenyl-diphosphatase|nr:phosphatase PAP2 family protein [Prevotellaceae bacterium]
MYNKLIELDKKFLLEINNWSCPFFDDFFYIYSGKMVWLLTAAAIIFVLIKTQKKDFWIAAVGIALVILLSDQISSGLIKPIFCRLRPTHEPSLKGLVHIVHNLRSGGFSFVSSHAANSFAFAVFTALLFKNCIYSSSILLWAALTAYSRMYLGVHYPLDILGGTFIGVSVGFAVYYLLKWVRPACCKYKVDKKYAMFIVAVLVLTHIITAIWHNKLLFLA